MAENAKKKKPTILTRVNELEKKLKKLNSENRQLRRHIMQLYDQSRMQEKIVNSLTERLDNEDRLHGEINSLSKQISGITNVLNERLFQGFENIKNQMINARWHK